MRPLFVLALAGIAASADPLRYSTGAGEGVLFSAQFRSETTVRRGSTVERFLWTRAGTQRVTGCARENGRTLLSVETDHAPARPTAYTVNGQDRMRQEGERLISMLPGRELDVTFLWLDDRGGGAPSPRDPSIEESVLRALDEIEVLPEGEETAWERTGTLGALSWKGAFTRSGSSVSGTFTFSTAEQGGARIAFEPGRATLTMHLGRAKGIEGTAAWTVATKDGTERRDLKFTMLGTPGASLTVEEAADAAADAAPMIAAQEAWRDGERDRAVELWEKAGADAGNRWGTLARTRALEARRDWPMLGQSAPALKAPAWIGEAPEAGKWQLVYFWATWAPRCEAELAAISELLRGRTRAGGAAVTRVDALQSEASVRRIASNLGLSFGVALEDGDLSRGFKVQDLPRVFLVDPDGRVRFEGRGSEVETLKVVLDRLAGE
ncbi:MAG: TlpA disulfide reductase family protein [Planctomycetota bacterium]